MHFMQVELLHTAIHSTVYSVFCDQFLPIFFSSSDHLTPCCTVPHQIKSLILQDTSAFAWCDFFSPPSQWDTLFYCQERCGKTLHQKQIWTRHDLSIWQRSPQRPHTHIKRHRWELCHPAKRPAELTALVEHTDYQKRGWQLSFVCYQSILKAVKSIKAHFSVKPPSTVRSRHRELNDMISN